MSDEESSRESILNSLSRVLSEEDNKKDLRKLPANFYREVESASSRLLDSLSDSNVDFPTKIRNMNQMTESRAIMEKIMNLRLKKIATFAVLYSIYPSKQEGLANMLLEERKLYEDLKNRFMGFVDGSIPSLRKKEERIVEGNRGKANIGNEVLVKVNETIGDIAWEEDQRYHLTKEDVLYLPVPLAKMLKDNKKIEIIKQ